MPSTLLSRRLTGVAQQQLEAINRLLENSSKVSAELKALLPAGQTHFADYKVLRDWLQEKTGIKATKMGDFTVMFYRFDFSGDSKLSLSEAESMIFFVLRCQRDRISPNTDGAVTFNIPSKTLSAHFEIKDCVGEGGQGAAYLAVDKHSGVQRVVKMYSKENANAPLEDIKQEFQILRKLDHPCIARVHDIFEDNSNVYVVSEPYFGGDLSHVMSTARKKLGPQNVTYSWLGYMLRDVLRGLAYLHSHMVIHCDIKEANLMVAKDTDWRRPQVVIIDFGLAKDFSTKHHGGTPGYMPPEVWQRSLWTARGDVFCLAVTLWSVLLGSPGGPFFVAEGPPFERIRHNTIEQEMDLTAVEDVSLAHLMARMAEKDFQLRPSADAALTHNFFQDVEGEEPIALDGEALQALEKSKKRLTVQNVLAMEMLSSENLAQLSDLNQLFRRLDKDGNGEVDRVEALEELKGVGMDDHRATALVDALVAKEDKVFYSEFMARMMFNQKALQGATLAELFETVDTDRSGFLDTQEVAALINKPHLVHILHGRSAAELLAEMDVNNDGFVSFKEFQRVMLGGTDRPMSGWSIGDPLQYKSVKAQRWIDCSVTDVDDKTGSVQVNVKPGFWFNPAAQEQSLRSGRGPAAKEPGKKELLVWKVKDNAAFYSRSNKVWCICTITGERPKTGCVMLDVKPSYWMPRKEQQRLLRPLFLKGDRCEYLSKGGKWIPCTPLNVDKHGAVELDVKPGRWISLSDQRHLMRRVE